MNIRILGTRGEIEPSAPYHRYHSGILINDSVLFDFGEIKYLEYRPKAIFITHLHPDHAVFVTQEINEDLPPIFAQEHFAKKDIPLSVVDKSVKVGRLKITPIPSHHSLKVASCAYLIEEGGSRLLYTGDLIWIDKKYHHLLHDLDLVITDGSFIRKGGMIRRDPKTGRLFGHAGIPNLIKLFSPFTQKIIFVHFGSWFFKNISKSKKKLEDIGRQNNIEVVAGYDGKVFDI